MILYELLFPSLGPSNAYHNTFFVFLVALPALVHLVAKINVKYQEN